MKRASTTNNDNSDADSKSSEDLLLEFKTDYPDINVQSLIGDGALISHGCVCPDYFAKAIIVALGHALQIPGLKIDPGWASSAGHGIDGSLMFENVTLTLELKWSCLAEVGVSIGWQWKTLSNQKQSVDIAILFGHLAFQPWMQKKAPELFTTGSKVITKLSSSSPPAQLTHHPATWFSTTQVLIYDCTQFCSSDNVIPPAKLQLVYTRKFKGMDNVLHPKNHIIHCTDLKKIRTTLIDACKRCIKQKTEQKQKTEKKRNRTNCSCC